MNSPIAQRRIPATHRLMRFCCALLLVAAGFDAPSRTASPVRKDQTSAPASHGSRDSSPRQGTGRGASSTELVHGSRLDVGLLEQLIFEGINRERARHRLQPFAPDAALQRVARLHSLDMASRNYFSHDSRRGLLQTTGFGDRLRGHGVTAARMAENIAMFPLVSSRRTTTTTDGSGRRTTQVEEDRHRYQELAQKAVTQWMESPGHRKNIMSPALETMGIGVALGQKDGEDYVYLTQDFGGR